MQTITRRAMLRGSAAGAAIAAASVPALAAASVPGLAADPAAELLREWLDAYRAAELACADLDRKYAQIPAEMRDLRVPYGNYREEPDGAPVPLWWRPGEADHFLHSNPAAAREIMARLDAAAARLAAARADLGIPEAEAAADAADELRYDLGYAIAEQGGTGPAAAAGRALVAAFSFEPGEEWTTLPALAFAETMRQALPELPADLAAAVETVLSEPTADAGFRRLAAA